MASDLKPCPFCGGKKLEAIREDLTRFYFECSTCGTSGPGGVGEHNARRRWNKRSYIGASSRNNKALAEALKRAMTWMIFCTSRTDYPQAILNVCEDIRAACAALSGAGADHGVHIDGIEGVEKEARAILASRASK